MTILRNPPAADRTTALSRPLIGTVIGDPSGIGPEVCVKALAAMEPQVRSRIILIGNADAIRLAMRLCKAHFPNRTVARLDRVCVKGPAVAILDPGDLRPGDYEVGTASAACGRATFAWVRLARNLCEEGTLDGWIMAPLNERALRLAGISLADEEFEPPNTFQLRVSGKLRAVPLTEHLRIRDVAASVKKDRIRRLITLLDGSLRQWGFAKPRIGVAGLNPHAMFEEDSAEIAPAIEAAKADGIDVAGPISPDSVFREAIEGRFDAVVTMYHDQGQIAVKTVGFAGACTVFLGLPYVRIGVPHGTAFAIAGTGKAQHLTMLAAMRTADALASGSGLAATKLHKSARSPRAGAARIAHG